jgi:hypothetical protein
VTQSSHGPVHPELRLIRSCPVTVDEVSRLTGRRVISSVTAASVSKELAEAPNVYLQDFYLGDGLSAAVLASADRTDPRGSVSNTCDWRTGSDDAPGLQISLTVTGEPLAGSLAQDDELVKSAAGSPSPAPGFPTDVHEVTAVDRPFVSVYTHLGSGAAAVKVTVDILDTDNRAASKPLQGPARTIMKAVLAEIAGT